MLINMKTLLIKSNFLILAMSLLTSLLLIGCKSTMSVINTDKNEGMNGGFESVKDGLPVNWYFYTEEIVKKYAPDTDFDIITDTAEYIEGKQSLKFLVRDCSGNYGHYGPGFFKEFKADPGETFKVSYWIKNEGCEFLIKVYAVSAFKAEDGNTDQSKEDIPEWRKYEQTYTITEKKMWALRFQLNILQPGTFWIDDLKIEKITNSQ